ncbi:MAG: DUF2312 domain-containing protein [Rickettsiales bacterium]|jgi:uncharacterized protein (UPF0335 family)|nr:DUF2312 domain-containing protein [Rickettsiales bacterium]
MVDNDTKLKRYVENIERLESEKKDITRQISSIYKEVSAFGFNATALKKIVAQRKLDPDKRVELEHLIEAYKEAIGMIN